MSIQALQALTSEETQRLLQAPAVVTVLIAGADQRIEKREANWAIKLVQYRTFTAEKELQPYYEQVAKGFEDDLTRLTDQWQPSQNEELANSLAQLKPSLAKLDPRYAKLLKQSWRTLAYKVAEASGGLVGFGAVDSDERRVIDLPMLD